MSDTNQQPNAPRVKTRAKMAPGEWETRVRIFEMLECGAAELAAQQEQEGTDTGKAADPTATTQGTPPSE